VTLTRAWEHHPLLSQRDSGRSTLGDQLPALIRVLEAGQAEAEWAREKRKSAADNRQERWEEVKKEAFVRAAHERNAKRLLAELASRDAAAAVRAYAAEIDAHAAELEDPDAQAARTWAGRIREHAERTDQLNGPLRLVKVSSRSHEELQPHMHGWSTQGLYRHD